jgi:hypothetical protein
MATGGLAVWTGAGEIGAAVIVEMIVIVIVAVVVAVVAVDPRSDLRTMNQAHWTPCP